MPKYSLAFGQNGEYFFSTELAWASQGLPEPLREKLYTDVQASQHFVSLGTDGEYFYARQNGRSALSSYKSNRDCEYLSEWIPKQTGVVQFSFGPGSTYIACTYDGACLWSGNLPLHIKNNVRGFHPVMATLGVDDAYVLVDGKGTVKWNLKGRYDQLDQILSNSNLAIEMVVVNPFAKNQYLIIFKNGTWRALLPATYMAKIKDMLGKQDEHDAQILAIRLRGMEQNNQIVINAMQNMATMNANFMANMGNW